MCKQQRIDLIFLGYKFHMWINNSHIDLNALYTLNVSVDKRHKYL
jgi:hypothetical protein